MKSKAKPIRRVPEGDEMLTTEEAAKLLKKEIATLYKWRQTGSKGPPSYGEGKDVYWLRSECEAWMFRQRRETADTMSLTEAVS